MNAIETIELLKNGALSGAKELRLNGLNLEEFPMEIVGLKDTLELLDLSTNKLRSLPPELALFKRLKIAFFSQNQFETFPTILASLPELEMIGFKSNQINFIAENAFPEKLKWLILTDNQLTAVPHSIGSNRRIQKLMLAGNQLTYLPDEMQNCHQLELLRISANRFEKLPDWLWTLPKLAWLAYAGNPIVAKENSNQFISEWDWSSFTLCEKLGEGASGIIYKAMSNERNQALAIKVFKGGITSDGLPESEMEACIAAKNHANLMPMIAKIKNHPEQKQGLVMDLLPTSFFNLGLPPTFSTCTRDVFDPNYKLEILSVLNIVTQVAEACVHLHQHGIMHGDLYAHNILINDQYSPILGDFGAATICQKHHDKHQPIEVRAWACLLEDLLALVTLDSISKPLFIKLQELKDQCMTTEVAKRPNFDLLIAILKTY